MDIDKPILCVDFDGVIHMYTSVWEGADVVLDGPVPGAIRFLFRAIKEFRVFIYSSRSKSPGGIDAMRDAITRWAADQLSVVDSQELIESLEFPTAKPAAHMTIDDRAFCFEGEWPTMRKLREFTPWNKR